MTHSDSLVLDDLRQTVAGTVHTPGDPGYPTIGFNVTVDRRPAAVVDVTSTDDVAATLRFAAVHGMTVGVHATGHGGTPLGGGSLLVRTAGLDTCVIDPQARTARIGAGVRWQTVIDAAVPHGLAPLCGSATGVGVVGFLTGGGIGPLVRTVGASSDYVRSMTVVTGDGVVRTASAVENPELFWGLRGGKATLGLVTEVVVEMPPMAEVYGGQVYFDGAAAGRLMRAWRDWAAALPDTASTSIALVNLPPLPGVPPLLAGRPMITVRYASVADPETAAAVFAPMRAVAAPVLDAVGPLPYGAIGAIHTDPVDPMPVVEDGALLAALPDAAIDALVAEVTSPTAPPLPIVELRQLGGAFAREAAVRSAVCHRGAEANLHLVGVLVDEGSAGAVLATIGAALEAVQPWVVGALPNFVPSADPARIRACYDADTVAWLAALADQVDPLGVLAVGQVVRG